MSTDLRLELPLPPPLLGSEEGTFAHYTVTQRLPEIARRAIAENDYTSSIEQQLESLAQAVVTGTVPPLADDTAPDVAAWQQALAPYLYQRWLDIPWFVTETYFYRCLLQITQYFQPGAFQGLDPFTVQKHQSLQTSRISIIALCEQMQQGQAWDAKRAIALLYLSLWGNRVDLSLWSAFAGDRSSIDVEAQKAYLLVDDTPLILEKLANSVNRVDFVVDNAGFELVCDLCLVDFLLSSQQVGQINLHLKVHPTFVSDAMVKDVRSAIATLSNDSNPSVRAFATRLETYLASQQLQLLEDWFWTSPLAFWEMPEALKLDLKQADLVLIKGDANYRRLLGDRHWPFTTPFSRIVSYFPTPFAALRTLKSEVAAGLSAEQVANLNQNDPEWLTSGRWGVIQSFEF